MLRPKVVSTPMMPTITSSGTPYSPAALQAHERFGVGGVPVALIHVECRDGTHRTFTPRQSTRDAAGVVERALGARPGEPRAGELVAEAQPRALHRVLAPHAAKHPQ